MAVNDFLPFATGGSANVESQATYAADPLLPTGNTSGIAKSAFVNKAIRQACWIASNFAQYLSNTTGNDVKDDVNSAALLATMTLALAANPTGTLTMWAGSNTTVPNGYLLCDGKAVSRTTYASLFTAVGTIHGSGDGSTTFNLPDLRGVFVRGSTNTMVGGTITAIATNQATIAGHGFNHSGVPVQLSGSAPTGLGTGVTYYVIYIDANTIKFAATLADAFAGTAIAISGAPTGTVVQWQDPDTGLRTAASTGGNTSGVGSLQQDQLASHNHTMTYGGGGGGNGIALGSGSNGSGAGTPNGIFNTATGGNENRSKNVYLNYIIKT